MVAHFDKVVQVVRARAGTVLGPGPQAVMLNAGGSVVPAGTATALGVTCPGGTIQADYPISIMLHGEITDFSGAAATNYYSQGGGTIGTAIQTSKLGFTVEASRLVINM